MHVPNRVLTFHLFKTLFKFSMLSILVSFLSSFHFNSLRVFSFCFPPFFFYVFLFVSLFLSRVWDAINSFVVTPIASHLLP